MLQAGITVIWFLFQPLVLTKGPQPFATFYTVKSIKINENQFNFFSESKIVQRLQNSTGFCCSSNETETTELAVYFLKCVLYVFVDHLLYNGWQRSLTRITQSDVDPVLCRHQGDDELSNNVPISDR